MCIKSFLLIQEKQVSAFERHLPSIYKAMWTFKRHHAVYVLKSVLHCDCTSLKCKHTFTAFPDFPSFFKQNLFDKRKDVIEHVNCPKIKLTFVLTFEKSKLKTETRQNKCDLIKIQKQNICEINAKSEIFLVKSIEVKLQFRKMDIM